MDKKLERKLEFANKTFRELLQSNEVVVAHSGFVILTNQRLLQASMALNTKFHTTASFWLQDIDTLKMTPKKPGGKGPIRVTTKDNQEFSLNEVPEADWLELESKFKEVKSSGTLEAMTPSGQKSGLGQGVDDLGDVALETVFGTKKIAIYKNGYIRISSGMGLVKSDAQKLLHIDGDTQITKKTGLGRAAGAVLTMGVNLASPNRRGNLTLSITTDRDVHVISKEMPYDHDIKAMHQLVAAGKAVIAARDARAGRSAPAQSSSPSLGQQISELNDLRESGLLTDAEFEAAKAKLLS
jgi:hypothetical protein